MSTLESVSVIQTPFVSLHGLPLQLQMLIQVAEHNEGIGVGLDPLWEGLKKVTLNTVCFQNMTQMKPRALWIRRCTCVLAESHLGSRDGVHLDYVVAVQCGVSVALVQQGGTYPVGITFHSLHLPNKDVD